MIRSASSRARDDASLMVDDEIIGGSVAEFSDHPSDGGETPPKRGRHVGSANSSPRALRAHAPVLPGGSRRPVGAVRSRVRPIAPMTHGHGRPCDVEGSDPMGDVPFVESLEGLYVLGRTIGRGEFAKVKIATCCVTGLPVAVKLVSTDTTGPHDATSAQERLLREIAIHRNLHHPHVVRVLAVLRMPRAVAIVMEWMDGGELFERVQRMGRLPETEVRRTMAQILRAVEHLHAHGVVHRDLKLENVLCDASGTRVALSDFGFARTFQSPAELLNTSCGSPCYAAPELVLDKTGYRGPPADLWSCGVIFYAVAFGHLPFEADLDLERDPATNTIRWSPPNVYRLYRHIATHAVRLPRIPPVAPVDENAPPRGSAPGKPPGLSLLGRDLLLRLLDPDPATRISMSEIWRHAWFLDAVQ